MQFYFLIKNIKYFYIKPIKRKLDTQKREKILIKYIQRWEVHLCILGTEKHITIIILNATKCL